MSNRPKYARRARRRRAAAAAFDLVRAVHGCECPTVDVRHRPDGSTTYGHDPGCPLIGRSQLIVIPAHTRTRRRQARPPPDVETVTSPNTPPGHYPATTTRRTPR